MKGITFRIIKDDKIVADLELTPKTPEGEIELDEGFGEMMDQFEKEMTTEHILATKKEY